MPGLPLLKLPFLVQVVIIKCLTLLEIFELSTTSKRAVTMIRQVRINMRFLSISLLPARLKVTINRPNESLNFWTKYLKKPGNVQYRQVDGSQLQLLKLNQRQECIEELIFNAEMKTVESELEVLERITKLLCTFMKFEKTYLKFGKQNVNLKNLFVWSCPQRFYVVEIPSFSRSPLKITSGELSFLLEHVRAEILCLNVSVSDEPGFKYQYSQTESSKIQDLWISHSNWVDLDNLLKMDIQKIGCTISHGLFKKVNSLLKSWISGDNDKLEELKIRPSSRFGNINLEALFSGISTTPTVFTNEDLLTRKQRGLEDARDIKREKDGLQATVCSSLYCITMIVWKEEHLRAIGKL